MSGGNAATTTTAVANTNNNTANASSELARLPGGAELNILQAAGSNGSTTTNAAATTAANLFRNGKLSLVNNGTGFSRVHLMHQANGTIGLAPIIVSSNGQSNQTHHILTASSVPQSTQLAGKVVSGGGR